MKCDFSGWATKNNVRCSDGRVIKRNAFKDDDGRKVPLVYNHDSSSIDNIIGHVVLENRDEGVFAYGFFNDNDSGKKAKVAVMHGDLDSLSIRAGVAQMGDSVIKGKIKEVSLVLSGANSEAKIENIMVHSDYGDYFDEDNGEAFILYNCPIDMTHADPDPKTENKEEPSDSKTIQEIFDGFTDEQKQATYYLVTKAVEDAIDDDEEEDDMKHNAFEAVNKQETEIFHVEDLGDVIRSADSQYGTLKNALKAYAQEKKISYGTIIHGITNLETLFPDAKLIKNEWDYLKRDDSWVSAVVDKVHRSPFARVKSVYADLTAEDARARGYITGKQKVEEFFSLIKRSTTPQTVYKFQKINRDDILDSGPEIIPLLWQEMRMLLKEEIGRAILVGDGRSSASDDRIDPNHIRPIWTDDDVYTIKAIMTAKSTDTPEVKAKSFITSVIKSRKKYKGSGRPSLFTTEDMLTDCLLIEDSTGRRIYLNENDLAIALRVKEIVTVPVMDDLTRVDSTTKKDMQIYGLIVNLADYNIGIDRGGDVTGFDDFDIEFNKNRYLIETRMSGALTKPRSAIAVEMPLETASPSV